MSFKLIDLVVKLIKLIGRYVQSILIVLNLNCYFTSVLSVCINIFLLNKVVFIINHGKETLQGKRSDSKYHLVPCFSGCEGKAVIKKTTMAVSTESSKEREEVIVRGQGWYM